MCRLFNGAMVSFNFLRSVFVPCGPSTFRISFLSFDFIAGKISFLFIGCWCLCSCLNFGLYSIHNSSLFSIIDGVLINILVLFCVVPCCVGILMDAVVSSRLGFDLVTLGITSSGCCLIRGILVHPWNWSASWQ